MEKITKELKSLSKFIGFIGLYQVYNLVTYCMDVAKVDVSSINVDAMAQPFLPVVKAIGAAPIVLSILVHVFLCIKGHKEANDPSPAKFHIILSIIWTLGYAFSAIGTGSELFSGVGNPLLTTINLLFNIALAVLMFFYSKYAAKVRALEKEKRVYY